MAFFPGAVIGCFVQGSGVGRQQGIRCPGKPTRGAAKLILSSQTDNVRPSAALHRGHGLLIVRNTTINTLVLAKSDTRPLRCIVTMIENSRA